MQQGHVFVGFCLIVTAATSAYMCGRECEVEKNLPFCKFMEGGRNMNLVMTIEKKIGTSTFM
jgi:hypothetical protein